MATLDLTAASEILKEFYLPGVQEQLNNEVSPMYSLLDKSSQNVVGEEVVQSLHTGRNPSVGSRVELGDLPAASYQKHKKLRTDLKYHYGAVQFTGQVIKRAVAEPGAFVTATTDEMSRLGDDLMQMINRQIFNDSNASLATVDSISGQVITLDAPTDTELRSFVIGMILDIGTAGNPVAGADSVVLTEVDEVNGTLTVTGSIASVVNGHFIRIEDSFGAELTGLRQIVSAQDEVFGIDGSAAGNNYWNSYVSENSGTPRTPTENLLQRAIDAVSIKSGSVPKVIVGPHDVVRAYGAQLTSNKRYNDTVELKGGFEGLSIATGSGSATMVTDRFAPSGTLWLVNPDAMTFNEASDWEWLDQDGSILERVQGKDAYHAEMFKYCELTTNRRNAHGRIDDLSGS